MALDDVVHANEFALTPKESDLLAEASDLIDAANPTDPRIKKAKQLIDGVVADKEGDG